ncbi:hypothetical protein DYB38_006556 [Aphanomyces astaci]|uniref:Uncharacterized protein n=1 Tax=Aphanomyces astaci TaxID=112090 RepID=A0A397E3M9_APHAT|nr:hypothetical protein DYB34_007538 [Aphanomyces astaci]RHY75819.1 hypothetical protein DYB38_006556 [Aphanomyces astaci]
MVAVHLGQLHIAKCLLDHGARVDTTDDTSQTPLMVAARSGHLKLVKLLLKRQAVVDATDEDGQDAVSVAAALHSYDMGQLYATPNHI